MASRGSRAHIAGLTGRAGSGRARAINTRLNYQSGQISSNPKAVGTRIIYSLPPNTAITNADAGIIANAYSLAGRRLYNAEYSPVPFVDYYANGYPRPPITYYRGLTPYDRLPPYDGLPYDNYASPECYYYSGCAPYNSVNGCRSCVFANGGSNYCANQVCGYRNPSYFY